VKVAKSLEVCAPVAKWVVSSNNMMMMMMTDDDDIGNFCVGCFIPSHILRL
jgi:hypothetical protein